MFWFDNFNYNYAVGTQTLRNGPYITNNWCAFGYQRVEFHDTDQEPDLKFDASKPAMPETMQELESMVWDKINDTFDVCSPNYFETSYVESWRVDNVPLKPRFPDAAQAHHQRRLDLSKDGTKNFMPAAIVALNPGTNEDLCKLVHSIKQRTQDSPNFQILCVDENIYKRTLKVGMKFV